MAGMKVLSPDFSGVRGPSVEGPHIVPKWLLESSIGNYDPCALDASDLHSRT